MLDASVTVGLAQIAPVWLDRDATIDKACADQGLDRAQAVVIGFSQGGAMTLASALRTPAATRPAAIACLSGMLTELDGLEYLYQQPTVDEPATEEELPAEASPARSRPTVTAADLLERANRARRDGRYAAAIRDYRSLQRRFPASREQAVSRVALGRLYLDQRRQPRAALQEFDRYLRQRSAGTLSEEAMVGRALAQTDESFGLVLTE